MAKFCCSVYRMPLLGFRHALPYALPGEVDRVVRAAPAELHGFALKRAAKAAGTARAPLLVRRARKRKAAGV